MFILFVHHRRHNYSSFFWNALTSFFPQILKYAIIIYSSQQRFFNQKLPNKYSLVFKKINLRLPWRSRSWKDGNKVTVGRRFILSYWHASVSDENTVRCRRARPVRYALASVQGPPAGGTERGGCVSETRLDCCFISSRKSCAMARDWHRRLFHLWARLSSFWSAVKALLYKQWDMIM